jgi:hypothetical protein
MKRRAHTLVKQRHHLINRYQCINFGSNPETIEFRTYKGSLHSPTMAAYMSFSHNLVEFAKASLVSELTAMPPNALWATFLSYLEKQRKQPFMGDLMDFLHHRTLGPPNHEPIIRVWREI